MDNERLLCLVLVGIMLSADHSICVPAGLVISVIVITCKYKRYALSLQRNRVLRVKVRKSIMIGKFIFILIEEILVWENIQLKDW